MQYRDAVPSMTLRIFEELDDGETVIALHGWLSAAEVAEVEELVARPDRRVRIDLEQLAGVDGEGLLALQRLRRNGTRFTGVSPYLEILLERTATDRD